ncbi:MAG: phage holin family protein [Candidatus Abawacabacteria bacterium]|nr:phage holin family protein [Candidatus Abawacabacteria bacterium]
MAFIINWLLSALAIIITAYLLPGVRVTNFGTALIAALVIGVLNAVIRPLLILLTLPVNILTLGLFTLVINAVLILLAARIVPGFQVDGLIWAIIFAIVLWIINSIFSTAA